MLIIEDLNHDIISDPKEVGENFNKFFTNLSSNSRCPMDESYKSKSNFLKIKNY